MIDMFHVKWKGYDSKQNTWEPLANLAGCEDFVAQFYEEQKQKNAEAAAEEEVLRLERHALPASSAGVERVFSAAGKMHDDLRKAVKDETLEASLLASFNHQ